MAMIAARVRAPAPACGCARKRACAGAQRRAALRVNAGGGEGADGEAEGSAEPSAAMGAVDDDASAGAGAAAAGGEELIHAAATALLSATAGLDRGSAATSAEAARVDAVAGAFERICASTSGYIPTGEALLEAIQGRWRLVYSSTFARVTTGGEARLAGLSQGFSGAPPGLGAVFQDIRRDAKGEWYLDNLVTLRGPLPLPLPLPVPLPPQLRAPSARATLIHKLSADPGESTLKIVFEETVVRLSGVSGKVALPGPQRLLRGARYHLVPSAPEGAVRDAASAALNALESAPAGVAALPLLGSAAAELERLERDASELDVVALGAGVRVTRSRLGELRVFVAAPATAS